MNKKIGGLEYIEDSFEENWDKIVNILAEIFGTDVALINRIKGSKLEVLKKNDSAKNPFAENEIYKLADVYCNNVVKNESMLEINNAAEDKRWARFKGLEYGLVAYLGYPIFDPQGRVVGTICVEDKKERYFAETEKELLFQFKKVIENQLKQIELTRRLEENIEKGKKLHEQYLPSDLPKINDLSFGAYYQSADQLGGDFYDVIKVEDKLLFYISDVSGHNLSSSMLNIFLKEAINSYLLFQQKNVNFLAPESILNYIKGRYLQEGFPAEHFICLILGIINLKTFEVKVSNAGFHFLPLVTQKDGSVSALLCRGLPITILDEEINYEECSYFLKPGDTLHLNTDGLIEQTNESDEFYGQRRLIKLLSTSAELKPEEILSKMYDDFLKFRGDMPIQDDLTSLLIQRVYD